MQVGVGGDFKICIWKEKQCFYLSNESLDNLDKF